MGKERRIEEIIHTRHLRLVPFDQDHMTETYLSWLNDPVTMRYSRHRGRSHTMEDARRFFQDILKKGHLFWAIEYKDMSFRHIGNIIAYLEQQKRSADISIMIGDESARGKGLGEEAFHAVVNFIFEKLAYKKVTAGTRVENRAMVRLMQSLGMKEEARDDQHVYMYKLNPGLGPSSVS